MGNGTIFGYDGKYVKVIDKIFNTIVLSLFWLIGCLPIITIGVSTTAMYYTAVKVIKNEEGYVLEQFLKSYRRNLKDGILLEILFAVVLFILQLNVGILQAKTSGNVGLFLSAFTMESVSTRQECSAMYSLRFPDLKCLWDGF